MPSITFSLSGNAYSISCRQGTFEKSYPGTFRARDGRRRGPIGVDAKYPWHFIWRGTGEHYFFNGTTAFWLMGWRDERIIRRSIERLHQLKINRVRVLLAGVANIYWGEPVMTGDYFTLFLRPWVARAPQDFEQLAIDYTPRKGYEHMVDFFTRFEWWETEPHDELVDRPAYCLAKPGEIYAVYVPARPLCGNTAVFECHKACTDVTVRLEPGTYDARCFSAFAGETIPLPPVQGPMWTLPKPPGWLDWLCCQHGGPE